MAVSEALQSWQEYTLLDPVPLPACKRQKSWDSRICIKVQQHLLAGCSYDTEKARLLANGTKESGAWLTAFLSASLATLLDDQSFRIAVALRLGTPLCHEHTCICRESVDKFGLHGKVSKGRKARHEEL